MNYAKNYLKIFLVFFALILFGNTNAQIGSFGLSTPSTSGSPTSLGNIFNVNVAMNWLPGTGAAVIEIPYDNTVVALENSQTIPGCMTISNVNSVVKITASDLDACQNAGTFGFAVRFRFICGDSCFGTKQTVFNGRIIAAGDTINSSCSAFGILQNNTTLSHSFFAYNPVTAEVTYRIFYSNPTCSRIMNPTFNLSLSAGQTITSVFGGNGNYTFSGSVISRTTPIERNSQDVVYYVVRLNCPTTTGQVFNNSVNLNGRNCNVNNALINGPATVSYTMPASPSPVTSVTAEALPAPGYFRYRIRNNGNTAVNLTATETLAPVHLTSVTQVSTQAGIQNTVSYRDCSLAATGPFNLTGTTSNSNVPGNTRQIIYTINNLQPSQYLDLYAYFDGAAPCNIVPAPVKDSMHVSYNCSAPPTPCRPCGPGGIVISDTFYNPLPQMACRQSTNMSLCKGVNDTVNFVYRFRNDGTGALNNGIFIVPLPAGFSAIPSTVNYTGFPSTPSIVNASNIQFSLPPLPTGSTEYEISFRAVIQASAIAGVYSYWTRMTGTGYSNPYLCSSNLIVCGVRSLDISKKVRGSLDGGNYSTNGNGIPNSNAEYQITIFNSGTVPVNNIVVIDRIPAVGNLRIVGTPAAPVVSQFNMQMIAAPTNANYTATYTPVQNVCTGWLGANTTCNNGAWSSTVANGAVKFTFNPAFVLNPNSSYTFSFSTLIPSTAANGMIDRNTAGIFGTPTDGGELYAAESDTVRINVVNPCNTNVTAAFSVSRTCSNSQNVFTATASQTSGVSHEWSLMQTTQCGQTGDAFTTGAPMQVQTGATATFTVNSSSSTCYYIKHKVTVTGDCFSTEVRTPITLPPGSNSQITLVDIRGEKKNEFCIGEEVFLDGSASVGGSEYSITIRRRPASGIGQWSNFVTLPVVQGQPGVINLTQLLLNLTPPRYFQTQYEYYILFTINNPANCTTSSTKTTFKIKCCDDFINPHFQLGVMPAAGSYTITAALFNLYAGANATHEWYVLSSPNQGGGPYTPEYSTTSNTFSWSGCQYGLYYTVIHKVKTSCGEVCKVVEQYQSQGRNQLRETDNCCLAFQFWPNGPSTNPQGIAGNFELGLSPAGSGHFTVTATPTYTYTNPNITHEWFVISSPAPSGPYTAAGYGTASSYSFSGVDGLYYFVTHKIKTPCGEVCFRQNISRNIKADKCDLCEPKECKPTETVWPKCYPPTNLRNDCRRENLRWDVVPGTASYQLELSYNDKECCDSKYPQMIKEFEVWDRPMLILSQYSHPKYECFRWRVRAKCDDGYSEWSQWLCYAPCPPVLQGPILIPRTDDGDEKNNFTDAENMPQVAPNPNNGDMFLQMKTKGELTVSVEVYNTQGVLLKKIAERKYPDGTFMERLSMGSGIPKGMYMVVFKTNKGNFSKKVIIQ